jgi:hypothetical protein
MDAVYENVELQVNEIKKDFEIKLLKCRQILKKFKN